jgi:hypothetical protein
MRRLGALQNGAAKFHPGEPSAMRGVEGDRASKATVMSDLPPGSDPNAPPPYPEITPDSAPDEAPQIPPVPRENETGRPHDSD